jgi:LacI family transcriptional regulator
MLYERSPSPYNTLCDSSRWVSWRVIMDDLGRFCCQNEACPDMGKRGHGNLTVTARYGPNKSRRMLRCSTCKKRFSERKGTPLFDTRLPTERVVSILAHVAEGVGTRKTARLTGAHRDTVTRYIRKAGDHAHQLHNELVAFSPYDDGSPVR